MSIENFDLNLKPTWRQGYRFQFEPAQKSHVILYPEGMITLNESAAAIAQYIDGQNTIQTIVELIKQEFGNHEVIEQDVIEYMLVAQQQFWIELK